MKKETNLMTGSGLNEALLQNGDVLTDNEMRWVSGGAHVPHNPTLDGPLAVHTPHDPTALDGPLTVHTPHNPT